MLRCPQRRMVDFINPSATADRNFSSSSATVEFHFLLWSDCSLLGDFSEFVAALLNREGNSTFCHCTFLAHRGPLLQPWRSDTILSCPCPSPGEEDATNTSTNQPGKVPHEHKQKSNEINAGIKHTQMHLFSFIQRKKTHIPAITCSS